MFSSVPSVPLRFKTIWLGKPRNRWNAEERRAGERQSSTFCFSYPHAIHNGDSASLKETVRAGIRRLSHTGDFGELEFYFPDLGARAAVRNAIEDIDLACRRFQSKPEYLFVLLSDRKLRKVV